MILSEHFTLEEMIFSQVALRQGIDNTPDDEQIDHLRLLCENILEPARSLLNNSPIVILSGYRSADVNHRVGGATGSVHQLGLGSDIHVVGWKIRDAFDLLRVSPSIIYDQIIFECASWVHISHPMPGVPARREMLLARGKPGAWVYERIT